MLVEPILFTPGAYSYIFVIAMFLGSWFMRRLQSRFPRMGKLGLLGGCYAFMMVFDVVLEGILWLPAPLARAASVTSTRSWRPRQDAVVAVHSLADHRRELSLERLGGTLVRAAAGFQLVVSYNPGYQSVLKDLKVSTRQRMVGIEHGLPPAEVERRILVREARIEDAAADDLIRFSTAVRRAGNTGLREVASTRTLVAAAALLAEGESFRDAVTAAVAVPLTDDPEVRQGLLALVDAYAAPTH